MYHFILGASDPEMEAIENLLDQLGLEVATYSYAYHRGARVTPGTAYSVDQLVGMVPTEHQGVWIECDTSRAEGQTEDDDSILIDHHNFGDAGYKKGPEEFWLGSSLGQVCQLLGVEMTPELALVAAADHCPADAYKGLCPGVDPDALMAFRAQSKAKFQKRSVEAVLADVKLAVTALSGAVKVALAGQEVHDLTSQEVPELPEAALRLGVAYLATVKDRDGRTKITLGGAAAKKTVERFMVSYAPKHLNLVDIYGVPIRGYAGGYIQ